MNKYLLFSLKKTELNLHHSLNNGQCFHWQRLEHHKYEKPSWLGIVNNLVILCEEDRYSNIYWINYNKENNNNNNNMCNSYNEVNQERIINAKHQIQHYFNLNLPTDFLECQYQTWQKQDPLYFGEISKQYTGVRVLRQTPFECLISFICSSCNNITRITQMLVNFRKTYGTYLGMFFDVECYQFPTIEQCCESKYFTEEFLKESLKFGFRSKYIIQTVYQLYKNNKEQLFYNLQENKNSNKDSHSTNSNAIVKALQQFPGVGPKVACCVALYSFDCLDVVPIDVHMKRLIHDYYKNSVEYFYELFGQYAGWAQMILFAAQVISK